MASGFLSYKGAKAAIVVRGTAALSSNATVQGAATIWTD